MSDYLIVGAGINGLLLARELASSGADITLIDQTRSATEASWAGGGIVSPLYPWRYPEAVTALANWAQNFYPQLARQLEIESGIDPQYRETGLLMLQAQDSEQALAWAQRNGSTMHSIGGDEIMSREPALATGFDAGLWMPQIANIRNPRLGKALVASLKRQANVHLEEDCQLVNFNTHQQRIKSVSVINKGSHSRLQANTVIVCAGAWSGKLFKQLGLSLPVEPVKGQMLLFKTSPDLISSIVLTKGRYLIPRCDGHLLVGSTLEYCGFDKSSTLQARESLLSSAFELLPSLRDYPLKAQWAGLRPSAPQGIPFIGAVPEFENLYLNAGQFRNGLVLAPASARLLADLLLHRKPIVDPSPYVISGR